MGINPIHPSEQTPSMGSSETKEQRQRLFEIQFETAVISDFIAVSGRNGSLKQQLSKIKNGLESGGRPDSLAKDLNDLISQINQTEPPGKAGFPPFLFSTGPGQVQAFRNFAISMQKLLNTAAEQGKIDWQKEENLFDDMTKLINQLGQMTTHEAYNQLNKIIDQVNQALPSRYKLPNIAE